MLAKLPGVGAVPGKISSVKTRAAVRGQLLEQIHPKVVEWLLVFASKNRCTLCHDVRGEIVPGYVEPGRAPTEDPLSPVWESLPASPGAALETVPSSIPPSSPRRWFRAARFDHRAHRTVNCLDCHAAVQQSERTIDLSLPDLTSKPAGRPDAKSCVECHHPGPGGAGASCVTCHTYHDARLEDWPVGKRGRWDPTKPDTEPEVPANAAPRDQQRQPPIVIESSNLVIIPASQPARATQPGTKPSTKPATSPAPTQMSPADLLAPPPSDAAAPIEPPKKAPAAPPPPPTDLLLPPPGEGAPPKEKEKPTSPADDLLPPPS
jgi:hypothetical protein